MQANCRKGGQEKQIVKERQDSMQWKTPFLCTELTRRRRLSKDSAETFRCATIVKAEQNLPVTAEQKKLKWSCNSTI
jgi:hypothetical protein